MMMAFVLPTDNNVYSILAHKTILKNKCSGNVSIALETIVPAQVPLVLRIFAIVLIPITVVELAALILSISIKLPRCEYAKFL